MFYWIISIIGFIGFYLVSFKGLAVPVSQRRLVQVLCLVLACVLPLSIIPKKIKKRILHRKIEKVSNVMVNGKTGYIDVAKFLSLKNELGFPKQDQERGVSINLADRRLLHPRLSQSFHRLIQNPDPWMAKAIHHQLAHFRVNSPGSIDQMIEDFQKLPDWKEQLLIAKYTIKKGQLFVKDYSVNHKTLQYMSAALNRLLQSISLPDMEFVISFQDNLDWINLSAPILSHCKRQGNPFIISIPDHEILSGYEKLDKSIDQAVEHSPWDKKKDIAFWRGATTSGDYHLNHWQTFPRTKLVYMGRHSNIIDAKFSLYIQGAESNEELLAEKDLLGKFLYPHESLDFRYLIDIDGNAPSYSRYYWILRSNCVPLKQMSSFYMWFYPALKPFVHFIPYSDDLSDLPKMVEWAQTHPSESRAIAENSRQFIKGRLTTEHAYAYLYLLLKEYAKLYAN